MERVRGENGARLDLVSPRPSLHEALTAALRPIIEEWAHMAAEPEVRVLERRGREEMTQAVGAALH